MDVTSGDSITHVFSEKEKFDAESPYTSRPASTLSGSWMKMLILLSLFTSVAMSCGDNAYRCVNPDGSVANDWHTTQLCMDSVGFSDTCWCSHRAEDYADPSGNDIQDFKDCCDSYLNFAWREC
jgi:hypothetical protein